MYFSRLRQIEDFPQECTRVRNRGFSAGMYVRNTISGSIFCESVKIAALVGREKIDFEY